MEVWLNLSSGFALQRDACVEWCRGEIIQAQNYARYDGLQLLALSVAGIIAALIPCRLCRVWRDRLLLFSGALQLGYLFMVLFGWVT